MNLLALLKALRPKQWAKNGLLFAALLFSQRYTDVEAVVRVLIGFALFSALASSGYLFNDIRDVENDRKHPTKCERPIAAGQVSVPLAWATAVVLMIGGLAGSFALGTSFGVIAASYLIVTLSYSQIFKHIVLLDVMFIAAGFILRAVAGAEAIPVTSSAWFLTCISFGALMMALSKRLAELKLLADGAGEHRKILEEYTPEMLEKLINIVSSCAILAYALYTVESGDNRHMMLTIPFVIYGIFRYIYLAEQKGLGGSPTKVLMKDRAIQIDLVLFTITAAVVLRFGGQ